MRNQTPKGAPPAKAVAEQARIQERLDAELERAKAAVREQIRVLGIKPN